MLDKRVCQVYTIDILFIKDVRVPNLMSNDSYNYLVDLDFTWEQILLKKKIKDINDKYRWNYTLYTAWRSFYGHPDNLRWCQRQEKPSNAFFDLYTVSKYYLLSYFIDHTIVKYALLMCSGCKTPYSFFIRCNKTQ